MGRLDHTMTLEEYNRLSREELEAINREEYGGVPRRSRKTSDEDFGRHVIDDLSDLDPTEDEALEWEHADSEDD